jgi:hypothetical protein
MKVGDEQLKQMSIQIVDSIEEELQNAFVTKRAGEIAEGIVFDLLKEWVNS